MGPWRWLCPECSFYTVAPCLHGNYWILQDGFRGHVTHGLQTFIPACHSTNTRGQTQKDVVVKGEIIEASVRFPNSLPPVGRGTWLSVTTYKCVWYQHFLQLKTNGSCLQKVSLALMEISSQSSLDSKKRGTPQLKPERNSWQCPARVDIEGSRSEMKFWFSLFKKWKMKWKSDSLFSRSEKWNENASRSRSGSERKEILETNCPLFANISYEWSDNISYLTIYHMSGLTWSCDDLWGCRGDLDFSCGRKL